MMTKLSSTGVTSAPETIAAIATAPGRGGIGVIRLSGTNLLPLAKELTGKIPAPRIATYANFMAGDQTPIDSGLLLYFPAPHSFTGEDVLELQGHGGTVVMQMLLSRCLDLGARLAEPGEFTKRAFLNGKLDLAQAEAVADLIDASSTTAAKGAIRSLQGEFSKEINVLLDRLTELRMLVEASLDFPEEEIDFIQTYDIVARIDQLDDQLARIFDRAKQGKLLQGGLHVVLAGQPNVGKSSLLNQLAGDEIAIVTPIAGTTRDAIRSSLQIKGVPLHIIDTAGLRETEDEVERIGISRTWQEIERSDVIVLLVDARKGICEEDQAILSKLPAHLKRLTVLNKIDLSGNSPQKNIENGSVCISLSAKQGIGIDLLKEELLSIAGWHPTEDVFIARERHLRALQLTQEKVTLARESLHTLELFAEELRLAQNALSTITGAFTADDLLGEIFGRFCIGK